MPIIGYLRLADTGQIERSAGLAVCGGLFRPSGIIYDVEAVRGICRESYWDSFEQRVSRTEPLQGRLFNLEMKRRVWDRIDSTLDGSPMVADFRGMA